MVYGLIGVVIWTFWVRGSYPYFLNSYIRNSFTIKKSNSTFPILGFVNIKKSLDVNEIVKIRKVFWDWLYERMSGRLGGTSAECSPDVRGVVSWNP